LAVYGRDIRNAQKRHQSTAWGQHMDHMCSEKGVAEVEKRPKRALEGVWAVEVGGKQQIWPSIKEKEEKKRRGGGGGG
jgi:hypothetical protein